jgi:IS30 family transposase
VNHKLRNIVASKLILDWSPEQISGWLKMQYPDDESMRVSHKTIYRALFIQARGAGSWTISARHRILASDKQPRTHRRRRLPPREVSTTIKARASTNMRKTLDTIQLLGGRYPEARRFL